MMGKLICFIFSVLLNYCFLTKICDKTDIKQFFSSCSENKREDKKCINSNNIPIPSKVSNVPCDIRCQKGKHLYYNVDLKQIQCNECPINTFSTGGAFLVNGALKEWSETVLKNFENHCYAYTQYANKQKNKDCSSWNLNQESTFIHSGNSYLDDVIYASQLAFGINIKRDGYVEFKYKKDSIGEGYWANGLFTFYLDYQLVVDDSNNNLVWQVAKFNLTKGYHNFLWSYVTYVEGTNQATKNLKAFIDYIKIDGVEYADVSCSKCINKFSDPGSDSCIFCNYNNYFNEEAQACVKCPSNTYSFPNSIGVESCKIRHQCTENDYSARHSLCEAGKRNVTFIWDEPLLCNNASIKLPENIQENCSLCNEGMFLKLPEKECRVCDEGSYSNNETFKSSIESCQQCPVGKYPVRIFQMQNFENLSNYFDNHCSSVKSENCLNKRGFKAKLNKIISGNYLPSTLELNLVLNFEIVYDQGEISYNFNLSNFQSNETFLIKINGIVQETFDKDGNYEKNYILRKGKYQVIWAYQRNNSLNNNNTVEIYRIFLKGTNLGGAVSCTNCFEGSIRSNSAKFCEQCPLGFTSNLEGSECIRCPQNTYNDGFTGGKCIQCPTFTVPNKDRNGCVLLDILHNRKYLLKINTVSVKEQIDNLCNKDIEICYGSFMGPIKKSNTEGLFFISPFDSYSINITDFTYIRADENNSLGYVYGLFPTNRINKNSQTLTVENTKVLENLGRKISNIKLFFYMNNTDISRDGFFIKYKEGNICRSNPSKFYQSYIFVVCDKSRDIRAPRLIHVLEECTYIFEWRGRGGCPQCLRQQSKLIKSACYQNTRSVFFQEESNCNIFPKNNNYSGSNFSIDNNYDIVTDLAKEDLAVNYYFRENHNKESLSNKGYLMPFIRNLSLLFGHNLTNSTNESVFYQENWREDESCTLIDDLDNFILIIIIVVPVLYFLFILLLIYLCCKYKKAKHNYQKLRDEAEGKDTINTQPDNNKIEAE